MFFFPHTGAALRQNFGAGGASVVVKDEDRELSNAAKNGPHKYRYTWFLCEASGCRFSGQSVLVVKVGFIPSDP